MGANSRVGEDLKIGQIMMLVGDPKIRHIFLLRQELTGNGQPENIACFDKKGDSDWSRNDACWKE